MFNDNNIRLTFNCTDRSERSVQLNVNIYSDLRYSALERLNLRLFGLYQHFCVLLHKNRPYLLSVIKGQ